MTYFRFLLLLIWLCFLTIEMRSQQGYIGITYEPSFSRAMSSRMISSEPFPMESNHTVGIAYHLDLNEEKRKQLIVGIQYFQLGGNNYVYFTSAPPVIIDQQFRGKSIAIPVTYTGKIGKGFWGFGHSLHYSLNGFIDSGGTQFPNGREKRKVNGRMGTALGVNFRMGRIFTLNDTYKFSTAIVSRCVLYAADYRFLQLGISISILKKMNL